jgi:AcrR family transcriptional regulator
MTELSRREQNRLDKRLKILDAALSVFARKGFDGASMDLIAQAAGLTKPTVYLYFASKDELFQEVMTRPREVMMLAFDRAATLDMVAQLLDFAWAYTDTVMRPEFLALARLTIAEAQRVPKAGRTYQESGPDKVLEGLKGFMTTQRDQGRLAFEDAELAAEDFWGLILSAPRNRALHVPDSTFTREELARYVHNGIRVFLRAYSTDAERDLTSFDALLRERFS